MGANLFCSGAYSRFPLTWNTPHSCFVPSAYLTIIQSQSFLTRNLLLSLNWEWSSVLQNFNSHNDLLIVHHILSYNNRYSKKIRLQAGDNHSSLIGKQSEDYILNCNYKRLHWIIIRRTFSLWLYSINVCIVIMRLMYYLLH